MLIDNAINQTIAIIMKIRFDFNNHQIATSQRARFAQTFFIISQSLIITNQDFSPSQYIISHFKEYLYINEITINR